MNELVWGIVALLMLAGIGEWLFPSDALRERRQRKRERHDRERMKHNWEKYGKKRQHPSKEELEYRRKYEKGFNRLMPEK